MSIFRTASMGCIAAAAISPGVLAGPASADTFVVSPSGLATASSKNIVVTATDEVVTSSKKKWKGGATLDLDTHKWKANVSKDGEGYSWGSYDNQEDAQAAGEAEADWLNSRGVMDGPGCNPPLILC
jgi:hypothetical protein